jgi:hypothetical protein
VTKEGDNIPAAGGAQSKGGQRQAMVKEGDHVLPAGGAK